MCEIQREPFVFQPGSQEMPSEKKKKFQRVCDSMNYN